MPRSNNNELAGGFTHWTFINSEQVRIAGTGVGNATIPAIGVPAGAVVTNVVGYVTEAFTDGVGGGNTTLAISIGDGTDPDGYSTELTISETAQRADGSILYGSAGLTAWGTGAYWTGTDSAGATTGKVVKGKAYTSLDTIDVLFGGDDELGDLVGGKLFVGAYILDPASYS